MDPNANLQAQEELIEQLDEQSRTAERRAIKVELHDLRMALRDWIRGGGFAPDWSQAPNARIYFRQ